VRRLRRGEWLAGAGGVVLLAALFLHWVSQHASARSGWASLGWPALTLAVAAILAAAWLMAATASGRPMAHAMAADVVTTLVGAAAVLVMLVRIAIDQPGADSATTIRYGAWIGLAGALLIAAGAWWALRDERTDARESAFVPPAARPAPPPGQRQGEPGA
jgi:hypothetical protein